MASSTLKPDIDLRLLHLGCEQSSSWMNLGFWPDASLSYPEACRALAHALGSAARLEAHHNVLDVGCGCGQQIKFWRETFKVQRIHAIDPSTAHVELARSLLGDQTGVTIERGFAEQIEGLNERYDRVLALDCAYHFRPRARFFRQSLNILNDGGQLALTDILLGDGHPARTSAHKLLAWACGIPAGNLLGESAYRAELVSAGFTEVQFRFIDQEVLGGFADFIDRLSTQFRPGPFHPAWLKLWLTARGCRWALRKKRLRYALITARRPLS